jgi:hypothetical protein
VGGLGLNLTSADTLVFVEHDWNPMRDLQVTCDPFNAFCRFAWQFKTTLILGTAHSKLVMGLSFL